MKAVIWADAFQATIMFAGALAIIIQVSRKFGYFPKFTNQHIPCKTNCYQYIIPTIHSPFCLQVHYDAADRSIVYVITML